MQMAQQYVNGIGLSSDNIYRLLYSAIIQVMMRAGKNDLVGGLERELARVDVAFYRERFRVPAFPQISPCTGFLLSAAGAFLLAAGRPAASFLAGISGAMILVLYVCGFSPLDWLGPKEKRSVLVVPGTPSDENRKALFLAIPLFCRLTSMESFSREAALRRASGAFGFLLSIALPVLAGAAALRYIPHLPGAGALAGAAMCLLGAGEWARGKNPAPAGNLAVRWVERSVPSTEPVVRPYILVYSGDVAEVKFFLAKYRRPVFRGQGIFVEFAEVSCGPPAVSVREGPIIPYRVDRALFSRVRSAGEACGVRHAGMRTLGFISGGRIAMSRGFKAVTIFRLESASGAESGLSDERAFAWLAGIASDEDLTGARKGV
jgi:hypothetical protein